MRFGLRALVAQGRLDDAVTDALAIDAFNQAHDLEDVTDALWRVIAAPALARRGETGRALAVAARQLELARAWGVPRDLGIALRTRALAEPDSAQRIGLMREALEMLRRTSVTGVDALTPAERRTADMAASGLSNREVAKALFPSVRTVENTLRRVYKKLGISSRAHLPAALAHAA